MRPDQVAAIVQGIVREVFEAQADRTGPRDFPGILEWAFRVGWDDGDELTRVTLMPGSAIWSERYGGTVRPVVFVAVGRDAQPHSPHGRPLDVPRFTDMPEDQRARRMPVPTAPATLAGSLAGALSTPAEN